MTKSIAEVPFPAVSVCHSTAWTWPSLVNYFDSLDQSGTFIRNALDDSLLKKIPLELIAKATNCETNSKSVNTLDDLKIYINETKVIQRGALLLHFVMFSLQDQKNLYTSYFSSVFVKLFRNLMISDSDFHQIDWENACKHKKFENNAFCTNEKYMNVIRNWTKFHEVYKDPTTDLENFCNFSVQSNFTEVNL